MMPPYADGSSPLGFLPARWLGILTVLAACLCVSVGWVSTKFLLAAVRPLPAAFIQLAASTVVVVGAAAAAGRLPRGRSAVIMALPGLLQPGLENILAFLGLALAPVSVEGILFALEAVLVAVLAWPFLGERPSRGTMLSIGLGIAGVIILSADDTSDIAVPILGVVLILVGVLAAALDTVISRALAIDGDPLALTAVAHLAGLATIAAAIAVAAPQPWAILTDPGAMTALILTGILLNGAAAFLFNTALTRTSAAEVAALFPAISVFNTLGGYIFLGERLALVQLLGALLVIISVLLVVGQRRAR